MDKAEISTAKKVNKTTETMEVAGLVRSLGLYFEINLLVFCKSEDSDLSLDWPWQVAPALDESSLELLTLPGRRVLVVCEDIPGAAKADARYFGANAFWLVPRETEAGLAAWPLSLESNLLSYSPRGASYEVFENYAVNTVTASIVRGEFLGTWTEESGFLSKDDAVLWERRANLHGIKLINTVLDWNPINMVGKNSSLTGFMPDLLQLLRASLNFR